MRDTRCQDRNGLEEDPQEHELQKESVEKKKKKLRMWISPMMAHSICENFRGTGTHESVLDSSDLDLRPPGLCLTCEQSECVTPSLVLPQIVLYGNRTFLC